MSVIIPAGRTIAGVTHHRADANGAEVHYVSAGTSGTPVLLVHGFPETWWAFNKLIPLLAETHRVFAIDLPGFGDSSNADGAYDSATTARTLHAFIEQLDVGPVHITAQDISGSTVFRLASAHPEDLLSFTAIETGLPGYGWEALADVAHGGAWHIGVLAEPAITEMLFTGREREFFAYYAFPSMTAVAGAITDPDIDEFVRTYSRHHGFRGANGLYRSLLTEGKELRALAESSPVTAPVLTVGAGGGDFTASTMAQAVPGVIRSVRLENVGHYAALEAPRKLASAVRDFVAEVDA